MNQGALVLDLRPAEQYDAGHLNGARQMTGEQILKAGDTLELLATNRLNDPIDASPAVAGKQLFLRGERYLYCIESP